MSDWKLVPREATEEMVSAGYGCITTRIEMDGSDLAPAFSAMIAAAPPVAEEVVERMAAIIWADTHGCDPSFWPDHEHPDAQALYRSNARAILASLTGD